MRLACVGAFGYLRQVRSPGDLIIFGAGGHALVVYELAMLLGYRPRGFIEPYPASASFLGVPIYRSLEDVAGSKFHIGLGVGTNFDRERVFLATQASEKVLGFPVLIHPTAFVSKTATLSDATVVLAQANVGPHSHIGRGSILNSGCSLDHESVLGEFCSLGPLVVTGGRVKIGDRTMIGAGAAVLQGISVGPDTVIGASAMVNRDVPGNSVAFGIPCRVLRPRGREESYL